jgi:hypothetical protein
MNMEWVCAKCGKIDKNPRGKHYWIPIEFAKKEIRERISEIKKLRDEFEKENNIFGTHFCDGYVFALEWTKSLLREGK